MERLLIVSNRLPVSVEVTGGEYRLEPSVGGLATGLRSFYRDYDSRWIGWPGIPAEVSGKLEGMRSSLEEEGCVPVELPGGLLEGYYYGFSNRTLWPLFHYFQQYAEFEWDLWEAYVKANRRFADAVVETARPGDGIWIHDYHLMLLPGMLKRELPESSIGFFLHIPFPSFELFRLLPWRDEIMDGILGSDLVGFHSYDYARHFLSSVLRLRGHERSLNHLDVNGRKVCVDVFPIGIDFEKFNSAPADPGVVREMETLGRRTGGKKLILSVDRLDYTKGILQRLQAFECFLEANPEYRERVHLVLLVVPSRTGVPQYRELKLELDRMVGSINSRYGDVSGGPIAYIYKSLPFSELAALYAKADVALVTPIRDGMNLVAKEYVACQTGDHGMLILSEMAGAVMELSEAIIVNPNNTPQVASAIVRALEMPPGERKRRMETMQNRIARYSVVRWARDFVDGLEDIRLRQEEEAGLDLGSADRERLLEEFRNAGSRLLLINCDGAPGLSGAAELSGADTEEGMRDPGMKGMLERLAGLPGTMLVLMSGRSREKLEDLFGRDRFNMVAEGGFWLKEPGSRWRMIAPLNDGWKEEVRSLLEYYEDRTPGSFIEEKDFSLLWHYGMTEPDLAGVRAGSLMLSLYAHTANMDLDVLEGNRVIEVRNSDVSKGRAAFHWLEKRRWDFILAVGVDSCDESIFNALPDRSWTLRVGPGPTDAGFRLGSHREMTGLLEGMAEREGRPPRE